MRPPGKTTKEKGKGFSREIILTGFGGQGIVLAGRILGEAASLGDHRASTFVQSYGPESRGGECTAQVILSDRPIHYPYVRRPDILLCMSQSGYDKYIGQFREDGTLITEEDLVRTRPLPEANLFPIPATRFAEEMGKAMMANIIMIGFLIAVTEIVSGGAVRSAVRNAVPQGTEEMNVRAFEKGHEFGRAVLKSLQKKAAGKAAVSG